jgi:hypothetical protein
VSARWGRRELRCAGGAYSAPQRAAGDSLSITGDLAAAIARARSRLLFHFKRGTSCRLRKRHAAAAMPGVQTHRA